MKRVLICAAIIAASVSSVSAAVLPAENCIQVSLPKFTFSVMNENAEKMIVSLLEKDQADDNLVNFDSRMYLSLLDHLPTVSPENLERMTFVVDRWFPLEYIEGNEMEIRVFLRQEAMVNPEGIITNESPSGAMIFMPRLGHAVTAEEAAKAFVSHVCGTRAKMYGAAST